MFTKKKRSGRTTTHRWGCIQAIQPTIQRLDSTPTGQVNKQILPWIMRRRGQARQYGLGAPLFLAATFLVGLAQAFAGHILVTGAWNSWLVG